MGNKLFCVLPWIHRFTNVSGEVQVCCTSEDKHDSILDNNNQPVNVTNCSDDNEILNSNYMKELRLLMLSGKWSPICQRCELTEKGGSQSRRNDENELFKDIIPELISNTSEDGTIPVKVRSVDLRLGNFCNLSCRMCTPRYSSRWENEWKSASKYRYFGYDNHYSHINPKDYDWYKKPKFWENFDKQLPYLRSIHFAGGEPTLIPQMVDLLQRCVDSGHSSHLEITYHTNVTYIPKKLKKLWPLFKQVKLFCSVDGYGKLNEFIRYPSKWDTVDSNLKDLENNFEEYGLSEVRLSTTVQIYNILQLEPLYNYLSTFKKISPLPKLTNLYSPTLYSIQILPKKLKIEAINSLNNIKNKYSNLATNEYLKSFLESIDAVIHFIQLKNESKYITQFLNVTQQMDKLRSQDTFSIIPELITLKTKTR